jgi:hypothetical protein
MVPIIAITVSTNYDDLLDIVLPQNYIFFHKWIIITSPNDTKTMDVIKKHGFSNVIPIFYDFYANGNKFNKGGAIQYCQKKIASLNYRGNILILDSDIYLPNDFLSIMKNIEVKDYTLYGTNARNDYHSYNHFIHDKVDEYYSRSQCFDGYFQLYKYKKQLLYSDSKNCAECDLVFHRFFKHKIIISGLNVKHLGKNGVNWNGRVEKTDFIL